MENQAKNYKYLDFITVAFVVVLLISNLMGSVKVSLIHIPVIDFPFRFTPGLLLFPFSYLVGDILTEVYGYAKSRRVIWTGFLSLIFANLFIQFFALLPPDPSWGLEEEYNKIFNMSFRVSIASMIAYFCGEFINSYTIAKLKLISAGKHQAFRIISSTCAGEFVDTLLVFFIGFYGAEAFPLATMIPVLITNYLFKILWEIVAYPLTRELLKYLKKEENEDYFDHNTNFNPFHLKGVTNL